MISSRREAFEEYKEARQAYSEAKTGVMYLPERLAALEVKDGMRLINQLHEKKHLAETYDAELKDIIKRRLKDTTAAELWSDSMYDTLEAYRRGVSNNANNWDTMQRKDKIGILTTEREELKNRMAEERERIFHLNAGPDV